MLFGSSRDDCAFSIERAFSLVGDSFFSASQREAGDLFRRCLGSIEEQNGSVTFGSGNSPPEHVSGARALLGFVCRYSCGCLVAGSAGPGLRFCASWTLAADSRAANDGLRLANTGTGGFFDALLGFAGGKEPPKLCDG